MKEIKHYTTPLLEWAINGIGTPPTKDEAQTLVKGLRQSLLKAENLIINARHTLDAAEDLRKRVEAGIKRTEDVINGS